MCAYARCVSISSEITNFSVPIYIYIISLISTERKIIGPEDANGVRSRSRSHSSQSSRSSDDDEGSDYSSSSGHGSQYSDDSRSDRSSSSESESDEEEQTVQVPQTDGTTIRFITVSKKKFDREQKAFKREAENTKREMERLEQMKQSKSHKLETNVSGGMVARTRSAYRNQQRSIGSNHQKHSNRSNHSSHHNLQNRNLRGKRQFASSASYLTEHTLRDHRSDHRSNNRMNGNIGKYQTKTQELINPEEADDFNNFEYELSDANLNLNHSVYPGRKFRGIAKSGKRWRARTCLFGKTTYGEGSFYNPFLAAMEYDRMVRANRREELSGEIKTKSQIILNFPQGLAMQKIRVHKLFERHLQEMDHSEMRRFEHKQRGAHDIKSRNKHETVQMVGDRTKEEPIIDNKGLATKIPAEFLGTINSLLFETERLRPLGPCLAPKEERVKVKHWVDPKKGNKEGERKEKMKSTAPQSLDQWSACSPGMSMMFGYTTLHISAHRPR